MYKVVNDMCDTEAQNTQSQTVFEITLSEDLNLRDTLVLLKENNIKNGDFVVCGSNDNTYTYNGVLGDLVLFSNPFCSTDFTAYKIGGIRKTVAANRTRRVVTAVMMYAYATQQSVDEHEKWDFKALADAHRFCYFSSIEDMKFLRDKRFVKLECASEMFAQCRKLKYFAVSDKTFKETKIENMYRFLYECRNLEIADFTNIPLSTVENMREMFKNCGKLTAVYGMEFTTISADKHIIENIFKRCYSLKHIHLKNNSGIFTSGKEDSISLDLSDTAMGYSEITELLDELAPNEYGLERSLVFRQDQVSESIIALAAQKRYKITTDIK